MAIKDKTITIEGAKAVVTNVTLLPQKNGSTTVVAQGYSMDTVGTMIPLVDYKASLTGNAQVDALVAAALVLLRKANGLE